MCSLISEQTLSQNPPQNCFGSVMRYMILWLMDNSCTHYLMMLALVRSPPDQVLSFCNRGVELCCVIVTVMWCMSDARTAVVSFMPVLSSFIAAVQFYYICLLYRHYLYERAISMCSSNPFPSLHRCYISLMSMLTFSLPLHSYPMAPEQAFIVRCGQYVFMSSVFACC